VGSFVPVFVAAERLEVVDPSFPNRAHNDFLELALEAGLPGLVLLAVLTGWLALRWTRRLRAADSTAERAELLFAGATLAVFGLHAVVDYPLRSMALAALAGVATGIILASSQRRANPSPPSRMEKYLA
jgi:O-antigen ligase